MSILGIGIDIVSLKRIEILLEKYPGRFEKKICRAQEIKKLPKNHFQKVRRLASTFTAKEAFSKACGTGFTEGMWFTDLEVQRNKQGRPEILSYGKMKELCDKLKVRKYHLSLSYEKETCISFAILEK
ncbi:MAG: holo-ACP synthase [Deltaproteobacteria bacterium]|nr:holo-ACP synthase [Deltaproteobacteria bacterium]